MELYMLLIIIGGYILHCVILFQIIKFATSNNANYAQDKQTEYLKRIVELLEKNNRSNEAVTDLNNEENLNLLLKHLDTLKGK